MYENWQIYALKYVVGPTLYDMKEISLMNIKNETQLSKKGLDESNVQFSLFQFTI